MPDTARVRNSPGPHVRRSSAGRRQTRCSVDGAQRRPHVLDISQRHGAHTQHLYTTRATVNIVSASRSTSVTACKLYTTLHPYKCCTVAGGAKCGVGLSTGPAPSWNIASAAAQSCHRRPSAGAPLGRSHFPRGAASAELRPVLIAPVSDRTAAHGRNST